MTVLSDRDIRDALTLGTLRIDAGENEILFSRPLSTCGLAPPFRSQLKAPQSRGRYWTQ